MSDDEPGAHPPPPDDLADRELPISEFDADLWRIYRNEFDNPLFFGAQARYRFDAPEQSFAVCYCARDVYGAFVETFGRSPDSNLVTGQTLSARNLVKIELDGPLELVDLAAEGLQKIGADGRLAGGGDYETSRRWSQALYRHPREIHGVLYRSRHDQSRECVAVYDRAGRALEVVGEWRLGKQAGLQRIMPVIDHYDYGVG